MYVTTAWIADYNEPFNPQLLQESKVGRERILDLLKEAVCVNSKAVIKPPTSLIAGEPEEVQSQLAKYKSQWV